MSVTTQATGLDRPKMAALAARETDIFRGRHAASRALLERARKVMPHGVPMPWMFALYGHEPFVVAAGNGASFRDIDANVYVDMNVVDMSMILGFAPRHVVDAVVRAVGNGAHFLLPQDDSIVVSELLAARTGLPFWQYTLSASGANVEAIRLARVSTGRDRIVIFDGKYHGHVEETMVSRDGQGQRDDATGFAPGATRHTRVLPFNDIDALRRELEPGEVACVLIEPALTNCTLLMPEPGYLEAVREVTRATGTLLIHDEAHTFLLAYGGLTRQWQLEPDIITFGKGLGTGIPLGAYGVSTDLGAVLDRTLDTGLPGQPGLAAGGTTFASNVALAAARAALEHYLTPAGYERTRELGARLADGIDRAIARHRLPWKAHRLNGRSGYCLFPDWPRTADAALASIDREFIDSRRLFMANRGVWDAISSAGPCVSFAHEPAHVDAYLGVLDEYLTEVAPP